MMLTLMGGVPAEVKMASRSRSCRISSGRIAGTPVSLKLVVELLLVPPDVPWLDWPPCEYDQPVLVPCCHDILVVRTVVFPIQSDTSFAETKSFGFHSSAAICARKA